MFRTDSKLWAVLPRSEAQKQEPGGMLHITRLLLITKMKQTLSFDNAWGEENEQLLF